MMAGSKRSLQGRIQMSQTNYLQIVISSLRRTAGPYKSAKRFTSHCKKHSDLSRRQTTMTLPTDLPNGDLQHLREMTLRSA